MGAILVPLPDQSEPHWVPNFLPERAYESAGMLLRPYIEKASNSYLGVEVVNTLHMADRGYLMFVDELGRMRDNPRPNPLASRLAQYRGGDIYGPVLIAGINRKLHSYEVVDLSDETLQALLGELQG
ncbi:hypothetical protein ACWIG4_30300 [Streptomyces sp. NPDC002248]